MSLPCHNQAHKGYSPRQELTFMFLLGERTEFTGVYPLPLKTSVIARF